MQRYVEGRNRSQTSMILMNLDKMIYEENPVRAIDIILLICLNYISTDILME